MINSIKGQMIIFYSKTIHYNLLLLIKKVIWLVDVGFIMLSNNVRGVFQKFSTIIDKNPKSV